MQTESLPVGGALRAVKLAVSLVMAVHKAAPLMKLLSDKWNAIETFLKTVGSLQRCIHIKHLRHVLILKCAVLMFIQWSQLPQINQCMGNAGNVYRNIGNMFKNHITIIEKNILW